MANVGFLTPLQKSYHCQEWERIAMDMDYTDANKASLHWSCDDVKRSIINYSSSTYA